MGELRTRRGPSGRRGRPRVMTMPDVSTIYVAGKTGDDRASGFQNTPIKSMAEAGRRVGNALDEDQDLTVQFLEESPDPDGYPVAEICRPRFVAGALRWRSDLQTVVSGTLTLTGRSGSTYTFAGKAWTPGEWVGYGLRLVASSVAGQRPGDTKHISYSTADTLVLCFYHDAYPNFAPPAIGDTFQIVRPSVTFNLSPYSDGTTPYLMGGTSVSMNVTETRPRWGIVQLRNIDFRVPDGQSTFTWWASGGLDFVGFETSSDGVTRPFLVSEGTSLTSGLWVRSEFDPGEYVYGWGFASRPRATNGLQTRLWMGKTLSDQYLVMGPTILSEGSWMLDQAGSKTADPGGSPSPHALWVEGGGIYRQFNDNASYPRIFRTRSITEQDLYIANGGTAFVKTMTHVGPGSICFVDRGGYLHKSGAIDLLNGSTPSSATGWESWVNRGGRLEMTGDQANLGDMTVGSNGATYNTRAAAPWAVNERLIPLAPGALGEIAMRLS